MTELNSKEKFHKIIFEIEKYGSALQILIIILCTNAHTGLTMYH